MIENKKLIIANWKMKGKLADYIELIQNLSSINNAKEVIICPAYPMIPIIKSYANNEIKFGAQDCSEHLEGAYTGEVSADMLVDIGCKYVIVGHSERRIYHTESSSIIINKINVANKVGLKAIVCVGENIDSRNKNNYFNYIRKQLDELDLKNKNSKEIIIAYEPVWAIGTGVVASIEQISEMHNFISEMFENKFKVVYGGSVDDNNIDQLLKIDKNYGVLIGNASTNLEKLKKIIN